MRAESPKYRGKPCKRGHDGLRYTKTRQCVECMRVITRAWQTENRERDLEWKRKRYHKNRDKILAASAERRQRRPWVGRESNWKRLGIVDFTWADYLTMSEIQRGLCAMCGQKPRRTLVADHDHSTHRVRGLLCDRCNVFLGHYENGVAALAQQYLGRT